MLPLKDLLNKSVQRHGIKNQIDAIIAVQKCEEVISAILGEKIAKNIKPLHLKNGVLTVACLSSSISQELHFMEHKIADAVNEKIGKKMVHKIRFLV